MKRSSGMEQIEPLVNVFRSLSDKTRLNILFLLAEGERNVTHLCKELSLPQPTVSHHLGLLRMQNLIANRRHGKEVYYCLNGHVRTDGGGLHISIEQFHLKISQREQ